MSLALLAVAVATAAWSAADGSGTDWATVAIFGAVVFVCENAGLQLPTSIAISPQGVLVTAAIAALGPDTAVVGPMAVASCGTLILSVLRERKATVVAFNAAQMSLTAASATAVYEHLRAGGAPVVEVFLLTALAAVAVNTVLVAPAAALKAGAPVLAVLADMWQGALSDVVFGIAGLLVGIFYRPTAGLSLVVALGVVVIARLVYGAVVRLRQAYSRMEHLYRFTERLQRHRGSGEAVSAILLELQRVMDASSAELVVLSGGGWRRTTVADDQPAPAVDEGLGSPAEALACSAGPASLSSLPDPAVRDRVAGRLGAEAMLSPMRFDGRLVGLVAVGAPRTNRHYGREDLRLLDALTNHAAVSLDNSRLVDQLRFDSEHDQLTALPNRTRFSELLAGAGLPSAVLIIDLDRFKEVNDTLGHNHGDALLRAVSARIADEVGPDGVVARLGGDEFAVLLPGSGQSNAAQVAVSLLAVLEQPFAIEGLSLELTASVGVAVAGDDGSDPVRLLQQADVAMHSAKDAHSGWELYSTSRDHHSPRRLAMAGELRRAIAAGELDVHYQPIAELACGQVEGVEALVRWRHPEHGLILPDDFVPIAEGTGLIRPLTSFVLQEAARQSRELRRRGWDLHVAVNLSMRSVVDVSLPDQVEQVLEAYDVPDGALTLEITEGSVMSDPTRTIGILGRLGALGVCIAIDDFGTGYSSLSYLQRLPATEVKIDRSFVAGMLAAPSDAAIVKATVDLAHTLGLRAVAEGVEDADTWSALQLMGCDRAQGWYVGRPMAAERLVAWLAAGRPVG